MRPGSARRRERQPRPWDSTDAPTEVFDVQDAAANNDSNYARRNGVNVEELNTVDDLTRTFAEELPTIQAEGTTTLLPGRERRTEVVRAAVEPKEVQRVAEPESKVLRFPEGEPITVEELRAREERFTLEGIRSMDVVGLADSVRVEARQEGQIEELQRYSDQLASYVATVTLLRFASDPRSMQYIPSALELLHDDEQRINVVLNVVRDIYGHGNPDAALQIMKAANINTSEAWSPDGPDALAAQYMFLRTEIESATQMENPPVRDDLLSRELYPGFPVGFLSPYEEYEELGHTINELNVLGNDEDVVAFLEKIKNVNENVLASQLMDTILEGEIVDSKKILQQTERISDDVMHDRILGFLIARLVEENRWNEGMDVQQAKRKPHEFIGEFSDNTKSTQPSPELQAELHRLQEMERHIRNEDPLQHLVMTPDLGPVRSREERLQYIENRRRQIMLSEATTRIRPRRAA